MTIASNYVDGMVSLSDVRKAYPQGLNGRDLGWIFRRMLIAVGNTRDQGLSHGAITPYNVFIHPEKHGLILDNWECSVSLGDPLQTISSEYKVYYPQFVFDKKPTDESLDMDLAVNTMMSLVGENTGRIASRFRAFFKGCKGTTKTAPHPAILLKEFDEFLFTLYGKPKFHHFSMPQ